MRFSIRDLLWATALVAMGLGWWNEHRINDEMRLAAVERASVLARELTTARNTLVLFWRYADEVREGKRESHPNIGNYLFNQVNWRVLDEPPGEP